MVSYIIQKQNLSSGMTLDCLYQITQDELLLADCQGDMVCYISGCMEIFALHNYKVVDLNTYCQRFKKEAAY
jgi:hypothetical protein